jgi:hypothetical protein
VAYFAELGEIFSRPGQPDLAVLGSVAAEHQLALPS